MTGPEGTQEPKKGLKRWHKIVLGVAAVFIVLSIIGALAGGGDDDEQASDEPTREQPANTPADETPAEEEPVVDPGPVAPRPIQRSGFGQEVVEVNLRADTPLVVDAQHSGGGNFIVELVGQGQEFLLANEIGSFTGQVLEDDVTAGRYRVAVNAGGSWSLTFRQPVPRDRDRTLPGRLQGNGPTVIPVQVEDDLEPIVAATNGGSSNFIVEMVGFGDFVSGSDLIFNEIGPFEGEALTSMPAGDYLVSVDAEGPWTLNFTP